VVFASGTGTTAYFVASEMEVLRRRNIKLIDLDIEIIAAPCATSAEELHRQMVMLADACRSQGTDGMAISTLPNILSTDNYDLTSGNHTGVKDEFIGKRVFANPYKEHLRIWNNLVATTGIGSFDLIYAPRAWELMHSKSYKRQQDGQYVSLLDDEMRCNILYYHCGGESGNETQLRRYARLGMYPNDGDLT
jgi:1-aminocyclopropane-1-carboxylate deaminase/D-cysteine desulfhydrase-like pyridoxal-dependent ACC family enzyme